MILELFARQGLTALEEHILVNISVLRELTQEEKLG